MTDNELHQVTTRTGSAPASYTWDVDGNLHQRTGGLYGDATFAHDWRDKLTSVQQGNTTTDILLDPLGRMVGKVQHTPSGDLARAYLHDGDQVVLEYVQKAGGTTWQPERRHIWSTWIDQLAVEQVDTDGDGSLETTLYPVTDLLGSIQLLTDDGGQIVERITYDPDGTPHFWSADTTRPTVTRLAWTGDGALPTGDTVTAQAFEIGLSEPIDPASVPNATATLTPDGGNPVTLTLTLAADSRTAYLTGATITAGTQYTLHLEGLTDTSGNPLWPEDRQLTVSDPNAYQVLQDTTAPQLLAVLDASDGIYLLFDEPVEPAPGFDLTTAITITRQGQPVEGTATRLTATLLQWQPAGGVGGLVPGGSYTISGVHLTDLNGNTAIAGTTFTHLTTSDQMLLLAYQAPTDTQPESASAYGLTTLFQGRTWHADLGMYSYRNRWYLPEMGDFAERDPLGPVDSVNLYQYVRHDPENLRDPHGLRDDWDIGPFGKNNPAYQRAMREYRNRPRVFFLPQLDFVEAWYFTSDGVVGSTVTTGLVDVKGRHISLDDQAYLLERHPYLPRYDNPGLAQLIRSPKLIKLTYAEQGKILLDWINLNLTIVQVTGLGVTLRGAILGLEGVAASAYDVGTLAGKLVFAGSVTQDAVERKPRKVVRDIAFFVIPRAVNDIFIGGTRVLVSQEKYILESLNELSFVIVDKGSATVSEAKGK